MKVPRLAPTALLFAGLISPALAEGYQDVISKAFPSFHILGRSEVKLDKGETDDQVKDHPGLVVGRINSDELIDFAALIRDSRKKTLRDDRPGKHPAFDYYDGYLVVCYGLGSGKYKCGKLDATPTRMGMPTDYFLKKVSPGTQTCETTQRFRPPRRVRGFDPDAELPTGIVSISFTTDAIGLRGFGEARDYVYQPDGMYLECGLTG